MRYDVLVADFDGVTRALCAFAGITGRPALRRFDRVARQRGVTTASATQVRRGLFDGGGRWRRYADQLAPVLPDSCAVGRAVGFAPHVAPADRAR